MCTSPFLGPPKVACNSLRSVFDTAHKRCNSNDSISIFEIITRELHATLLRNHGAGSGPGRVALAPRGGGGVVCAPPLFLGPPKVARNSTRSFLDIAHKRCNSNDAISKSEIRAGELRATLLRNHGVGAEAGTGRAPGQLVTTLAARAGASPRPLLPAALLEHLLEGGGAARVDLLVGDLFGGGQQVGGVRVWRRDVGP